VEQSGKYLLQADRHGILVLIEFCSASVVGCVPGMERSVWARNGFVRLPASSDSQPGHPNCHILLHDPLYFQ